MTGSFLPARAGRYACLLTLVATLQTVLPTGAVARDDLGTGGLDAVLPGWDAFSGMLARGWSSMAKAVGSLPTPALPSSPAILTTRRACLDRDGGTSNDCTEAVSFVCRQHGFESGRQIDVASGQVCRPTPQGFTQIAHALACKPKVWLTQVACW